MAWIFLFIAGIFEIVWATSMKLSDGFSRLTPALITVVGMAISVFFLALSMKQLPLGTAYVIWTGIGAVGAFLVGIFYFHEPVTAMRILFASMILLGLLGLKFTSAS